MDLQLGYYYDYLARNLNRLRDTEFRARTVALFESCGTRLRPLSLLLRWLRHGARNVGRLTRGRRSA